MFRTVAAGLSAVGLDGMAHGRVRGAKSRRRNCGAGIASRVRLSRRHVCPRRLDHRRTRSRTVPPPACWRRARDGYRGSVGHQRTPHLGKDLRHRDDRALVRRAASYAQNIVNLLVVSAFLRVPEARTDARLISCASRRPKAQYFSGSGNSVTEDAFKKTLADAGVKDFRVVSAGSDLGQNRETQTRAFRRLAQTRLTMPATRAWARDGGFRSAGQPAMDRRSRGTHTSATEKARTESVWPPSKAATGSSTFSCCPARARRKCC